MRNDQLRISVVTVSYNAADTIEETIRSVVNQTYQNVEYIIIDGGSTDGTVDIIKRYADRIAYWVSEPDRGIYDAMNKGIAVATGDYINFMNAGDTFYDSYVLQYITRNLKSKSANVIFGKTLIDYTFGSYIVTPDNPKNLISQMCLCHQSVLISLDKMKQHPYDISLRISGDHKSLLSIYNDDPCGFVEYEGIIAKYDAKYGVSSKQVILGYKEGKNVGPTKDSYYRRLRIHMRAYLPQFILIPLCRLFFSFKSRYRRIK